LESAGVKLLRARHHLASFESEASGFLKGPPIPYGIDVQVEEGEDGEREVHVFRALASPPPELNAIAGDVIQNARSALDHLVYQASLAHTRHLNSEQRREAAFPIATSVRDFSGRGLGAVAPVVVSAIEALQPYHASDLGSHPLARLKRLSDLDKHRHLHLVFTEVAATALFPGKSMKGPVRLTAPGAGAGPKLLEDGAVIATAVRDQPGVEKLAPSVTPRIGFHDTQFFHIRGASGLLREILEYVEDQVVGPIAGLLSER
jgi:hypothetical protein